MQWFIRLVSGTVNASEDIVRTLCDILSGPVAFLGFRESISFDVAHFNMAEGQLQMITSPTNFIDTKAISKSMFRQNRNMSSNTIYEVFV